MSLHSNSDCDDVTAGNWMAMATAAGVGYRLCLLGRIKAHGPRAADRQVPGQRSNLTYIAACEPALRAKHDAGTSILSN